MSHDDRKRAIGKVVSVAADRFVVEMHVGTDNFTVVGFDDIPAASHVTPRLTTVHTPLAKLAEAATSSLLSALAAGRAEGGPVVVPVTLVVRESTAALT